MIHFSLTYFFTTCLQSIINNFWQINDSSNMLQSFISLLIKKPLSVKLCPWGIIQIILITTGRSAWNFSENKSIRNASTRSYFIWKSKNFSLCSKRASFNKSTYWFIDLSAVLAEILFQAKSLSANFVNLWDDTSGTIVIKTGSRDRAFLTMLNCMGDL